MIGIKVIIGVFWILEGGLDVLLKVIVVVFLKGNLYIVK